jgi:hypothetical protein
MGVNWGKNTAGYGKKKWENGGRGLGRLAGWILDWRANGMLTGRGGGGKRRREGDGTCVWDVGGWGLAISASWMDGWW